MSTFVLIHGGWHGAWCWDRVAPLLEQAGHEVVRFDLPGHGEDRTPAAEVTLQGYTDRVVEALDAQPEPVVLVGHSLGGIAISQAAEQRPEKIEKLVYLCALLLPGGNSASKLGVFLWAPSPQAGEAHGCVLSTHPLVDVPMEQAQIATVPRREILRGVGQPPIVDRGVRPVERAQGPPTAPLPFGTLRRLREAVRPIPQRRHRG